DGALPVLVRLLGKEIADRARRLGTPPDQLIYRPMVAFEPICGSQHLPWIAELPHGESIPLSVYGCWITRHRQAETAEVLGIGACLVLHLERQLRALCQGDRL